MTDPVPPPAADAWEPPVCECGHVDDEHEARPNDVGWGACTVSMLDDNGTEDGACPCDSFQEDPDV